MKRFVRLTLVIIALMFSAIATSETTEEQENVCESYYDYDSFISVAQVNEQLVSRSWPELPMILRQARMIAYAIFQIKVSPSGEVCYIEFIGGNSVILKPLLAPEIKKWKFRSNRPFWGLVVIRYESGRGFQLL